MNDTTTSAWPHRAAGWLHTHRTAAVAVAAAVVIVAGGGTVAGTAMTKQSAVDDWTGTRAKLTATVKTASTVQGEYGAARKQTQTTAALAKELVDVRGGAMDDKLWKTLSTARDAATKAAAEPSLQLVTVPKFAGTDRAAYETATAVGRKALAVNRSRVATVKSSTHELKQARAAVLDAGGKIAATVAKDEESRKGKYPDATQQIKDAVHRAAGNAICAQQQHPDEDLVLTSTRDYLKAVHALQKSNAEQAAAKKAALDAQAAAAAAAAQTSTSAGSSSTAGRATGGGWSSSTGSSPGFSGSGGGHTPAPGQGPSGGSGSSSATGGSAPAPSTGGSNAGGSGSSGGEPTVRPPQYALMHATKVASCTPGEYNVPFGPNINSVPPRYTSVSSSWNGSDWVYSGMTCAS
jgi:uncharacterized membrane protein YgcG